MDTPTTRAMLLVEDNAPETYLIRQAIGECGSDIRLFLFPDGEEALAFHRNDPPFTSVPTPSLILLDLTLPTMPGTHVLTEIRHLPAHQATPVIIFSGADKEQEEARCLQLGATAYVQKSSDFSAYFSSVKAIVMQWLSPASA
jgi:CheY-like chemotaxis protein